MSFQTQVGAQQKTEILRQIGFQMEAGIPIHLCVESLIEIREGPEKMLLSSLRMNLMSGRTMSESLASGGTYEKSVTSLVRVGEETGALPQALAIAVAWRDKDESVRRQLIGALTYPAVVLIASLGMAFLLFRSLVPPFAKMANDIDAPLPLISKFVFSLSDIFQSKFVWLVAILLFIQAAYWIRTSWKSVTVRRKLTGALVGVPGLGELLKLSAQIRMFFGLSALLRGGSQLTQALTLASVSSANPVYETWGVEARKAVLNGDSLSSAFRDSSLFHPFVPALINVGEESGKLEEMCSKLVGLLSEDLGHRIEVFTALAEPILLVFSGFCVGVVLLSTFLPLYHVIGKV